MRPWECSQTDRYTHWQTNRRNRFYNLPHGICYSYGTDKDSLIFYYDIFTITCKGSLNDAVGFVIFFYTEMAKLKHKVFASHPSDTQNFMIMWLYNKSGNIVMYIGYFICINTELYMAHRSIVMLRTNSTRSSATAKSTARPSCSVSVLYNISLEKIFWWLINHFYVIGHERYRIRRNNNNDHYAVQGHSKSPILVPIESPYATSY